MLRESWLHGCGVCMRTVARVRRAEARSRRLHEIEMLGLDAEAPVIAAVGVLIVILPLFIFLVSVVFGAYYLAGA